jgi:hypothetical protein
MAYEIDDLGIRVIGYGVPISFYDPTRVLRAQIYLQGDNTLNLGGIYGTASASSESTGAHALSDGTVHTGALSDDQGPQFLLTDGSRPMMGDLTVFSDVALRSEVYVPGTTGFSINEAASELNDVTVRGTIVAAAGSIGGWTIDTGHLYAGSGGTRAGLAPATYPFYAGSETQASAPFRVTPAGALTATSATITGAITATSGTLGDLAVTGTVTVGAASPYIQIDGSNKWIQSSNFAAGLAGMRIESDGDAEFNNVTVRGALSSTVFVKDLIDARAGTLMIVKSAGMLASDMVVPGSGTWSMLIEDPPGGGFLFANSDICRCKSEYASGIGDIWFVVSARADEGDGTQSYTCTYSSGTRSITYPAGAPVLDYGVSGDGGLYLTADDTNGPFLSVFTHAGAPWTTQVERVRLGNLNGLADYVADAYGIFIGDYSGDNWMAYDPTNSLRIRGDAIIDGTLDATKLSVGMADQLFSNADGLLLLGPYDEITATAWTSQRGQTATLSGAFHQVAGPWPGTRALMTERATTNLVTNPSFEVDTTGWTASSTTVARVTTDGFIGSACATVTLTADSTAAHARVAHTISGATTGRVFTGSVYVKAATASDVGETCGVLIGEIGGAAADAYSAFGTVILTTTWQRVEKTYTLVEDDRTSVRLLVYPSRVGGLTGDAILLDAAQLEELAIATSYADGTLGTGYAWTGTAHASTSTRSLSYTDLDALVPLVSGAATVTHSVWVKANYDADADWPCGANSAIVADYRGADDNNRVIIYYLPNSSDAWAVYLNGSVRINVTGQTFVAGDWLHLVVTLDYTNDSYVLYLNGENIGSSTATLSAPASIARWKLGTREDGSGLWTGGWAVAEYAVFDRVLTDAEVAGLYLRNAALTDAGAMDTPGIYILDGQFRIASSTAGTRIEITSDMIAGYSDATTKEFYLQASDGKAYAGGGAVVLDAAGISAYNGSSRTFRVTSGGTLYAGSLISAVATTSIAIFSSGTVYNTESVGAGDVLLGDNSAGKANLLWDASAGQLKFRGGTTAQVYINTDGTLVAGGGAITLGTTRQTITSTGDADNYMRWLNTDITTYTSAYGYANLQKTDPDSNTYGTFNVGIQHDANNQSGVNSWFNEVDIFILAAGASRYVLEMNYDYSRFNNPLRLTTLSSDPSGTWLENGYIYYNTTSHKFVGRANGSWVNLH